MKKISCIICPNSCLVEIDEKTHICIGNKCIRGEKYAIDEITNPKRSITSSVLTIFDDFPCVSVKTDKEIAKKDMFKVIELLKNIKLDKRLPIGSIILENILDTDVNIITTKSMEKGE